MPSTKRASQILVALSVWALISAVVSLLVVKVVYMMALPTSLMNLRSDIHSIQDLDALKKISVLLADSVAAQKETGWLLISWGLWFVATWAVIFGIASVFLYRQLAKADVADNFRSRETILDLAFAGKLELWKAFWGLYIALPLTAALVVYGVMAFLKSARIVEPTKVADLILTPLAYSAVLVIFWGGAVIAWRCSANTPRATWRFLARIAIVLYTVLPLAKSAALLSYYLGRYG